MVSSFFDIFTELSLDGGQTWSATQQSARVDLFPDASTATPVSVPTSLLPPPNQQYVTPPIFQASYGPALIIKDIKQLLLTQSVLPPAPGANQTQQFNSPLDFQASLDGGKTFGCYRATASAAVNVASITSSEPALFDTEMLQLNINGGDMPPGLMIRESPTEASRGATSIEQGPDGTFRISSFFDVFTEFSMDGGQSWTPSESRPAHFELVDPAPESAFPSSNLPRQPESTSAQPTSVQPMLRASSSGISAIRASLSRSPRQPPEEAKFSNSIRKRRCRSRQMEAQLSIR